MTYSMYKLIDSQTNRFEKLQISVTDKNEVNIKSKTISPSRHEEILSCQF